MNKKGFELLGKEMLQLIVAIICILVLVYFLVSWYTAHLRNKELEEAKASLEHLISEINSGKEQVEIYNPKDWTISSWSSFSDENIPKLCSNEGWEKCICICIPPRGAAIKSRYTACLVATKGEITCKESDFAIEEDALGQKIMGIINPPLILTIDYEDENKIISKKTGGEEGGGVGEGS